jgi:hypothetical protein
MRREAFLDQWTSISDHLDRVIPPYLRRRWSVWFIFCDEENGRALLHCPVDNVPAQPTADQCLYTVANSDRQWFQAAHRACAERGVRLLGVHLMTPAGQREVVLDDVV